jgi:hypothetical protein
MARITTTQKNHLNNMNRSADDVSLGTRIYNLGNIATGSWVVTGAQQNASSIIIDTGLGSSSGQIVQLYRSGSVVVTTGSFKVANASGSLTIGATAGYVVSASDIVNWIAFS